MIKIVGGQRPLPSQNQGDPLLYDMDKTKRSYWRTNTEDEKARRLWCANEAVCIGRGGITFVALVTGVSRTTLTEGVKEIKGENTCSRECPQKRRR